MTRTTFLTLLIGAGLVILPTACGGNDSPSPKPTAKISLQTQPSDSEALKAAKQKYTVLCQTCHGMSGRGDGVAGQALNPQPRSFTDPSWQASVTDDHIRRIIVGGGQAVGKSPLMPGNDDLRDKPEVVGELVRIVRSFGE